MDNTHTNKYFTIYTDGACTNNGRPGAKCSIGVHFSEKNELILKDISKVLSVPKPTNNIAELTAILESMKIIKGCGSVLSKICGSVLYQTDRSLRLLAHI